ncbi:MAG: glycosyltransferase family 2 protein [Arenimonas sp.]
MPSFNQSQYIRDSINSVLAQDYPNLELIVMDGNSSDGSQAIIEEIAKKDARLKWTSEPDSGPANAINKALLKASGLIIGWLNSDDLYAQGAVSHAVSIFANNAQTKLIYGEAAHIDALGAEIDRYPTREPSIGIQGFHDSCYICQPTVFFESQLLSDIGLLDESLQTAFDFDYWLRVFNKYQENVLHTKKVLAYSRLHESCITRTLRRKVALESMQVLARHAGTPKAHWLGTHLGEYLESTAFKASRSDLYSYAGKILNEIEPLCVRKEFEELKHEVFQDARFRLYEPGLHFDISTDGWVPRVMSIGIQEVPAYCDHLILQCRHSWPTYQLLSLKIESSWGYATNMQLASLGEFRILVPLTAVRGEVNVSITIAADNGYIPSKNDVGSSDDRELSFILDDIRIN